MERYLCAPSWGMMMPCTHALSAATQEEEEKEDIATSLMAAKCRLSWNRPFLPHLILIGIERCHKLFNDTVWHGAGKRGNCVVTWRLHSVWFMRDRR